MAFDPSGLLGAGMQAWGLINSLQDQKWDRGQIVDQMNRQQEAISYGRDRWQASGDPAQQQALNLIELFGGDIQGSRSRLNELAEQFPGLIESLSGKDSDPFGRGTNPAMSALLERMGVTSGKYDDASGAAMSDYLGGNPQGTDLMDRIMDLVNGQGEQMAGLTDIGGYLTGTRGRNDFINNASERGIDMMNRGGMTDILNQARSGASGIIDSGGATSVLSQLMKGGLDLFGAGGKSGENQSILSAALKQLTGGALGTEGLTQAGGEAEQVGLNDLKTGGRTAESDYLLQRGKELSAQNPLLPMEQVYQIAREEAGRSGLAAYQKATRDAVNRGGKAAGITRGTGETGEYADLLARTVSDAGRKALTDQQGLQLQQTGVGAGMVGNAGSLNTSRYGAASDLVKGMEGNATQRYSAASGLAGTALQDALSRMNIGAGVAGNAQEQETRRLLESLGLLPKVSDSAGTQANIFGQLGLGAEGQANNNLKTGLDAYNMYNTSRLGGINAGTNQLDQNSRAKTNSGNLLSTLLNGGLNADNTAFGNNLATGTFGAQLNDKQLQALQQLFNNNQSMNNNNYAGLQGGIGNLISLAGLGQSYSAAGLPSGGGIGQAPNSGASGAMGTAAQSLANTNWGGLFSNRPKTGGTGTGGNYTFGDDPYP